MDNNTNSTLRVQTLSPRHRDFAHDDWVEVQIAEDRERFELQLAAGMYDCLHVKR